MKRQFLAIPLLLLSFCFIFSSKSIATTEECENPSNPNYLCAFDSICSNYNDFSKVYTPVLDNNGNPIMCGPQFDGDTDIHPCCAVSYTVKVIVGDDECASTFDGYCDYTRNNCVLSSSTQVVDSSGQPIGCNAETPCCLPNDVTSTDNPCRAVDGTCLQVAPTTYAYTILTSPPGCTIDTDRDDPYCNLCRHNAEKCYKSTETTFCAEGKFNNQAKYRDESLYKCYEPPGCPSGHLKWNDSDGEMRPCKEGSDWVCCTNFDTTGREQANPNKLFCIPGNESSGINTAIGCIPVGSGNELITAILNIAIGLGGGIALALILYGVFIVTTSAGMPDKLKAGSEIITSAIVGLIFILLSIFLVNLIGINILGIPGLT